MGGVFLLLSKISFYGTTLILVILILVLSFRFNKKMDNKKDDKVSDEYIASYIDGEYQTEIPGKDDGYVVDKIVCDNGATATWNTEEWGINIRNATQKVKCSIYFKYQFEQDFNYTATEQVLAIPKSGTYKLEVWGAQGGDTLMNGKNNMYGGYGGYSIGIVKLDKNKMIYLNVGGSGAGCTLYDSNPSFGIECPGGYNGGGTSISPNLGNDNAGTGGGATHIALVSGLLSTLQDNINDILIVSGGGGGSYSWKDIDYAANGGHAGGYKGVDGYMSVYYASKLPGGGGTQVSAGTAGTMRGADGKFGQGGDGGKVGSSGGGGGFYGGGASAHNGSGGGSGYIGNSLLSNKAMYCYNCEESSEESTKTISTTCTEEKPTENCAKKGNGYARITYID